MEHYSETGLKQTNEYHDSPNAAQIAAIVSPDAPMTTNEKGGSQSDIPVRFDLIDGKALFEMAKVLDYGAKKYGADNWRLIDVNDHLNHLLMHTYAYLAGDRTDEHLSHILCRATFALGVTLQEFSENQIMEDSSSEEHPNKENKHKHRLCSLNHVMGVECKTVDCWWNNW